mgnify:CR=1 FL=1
MDIAIIKVLNCFLINDIIRDIHNVILVNKTVNIVLIYLENFILVNRVFISMIKFVKIVLIIVYDVIKLNVFDIAVTLFHLTGFNFVLKHYLQLFNYSE